MFSLTGYTLITFGVLIGGILTHTLKQFITAKRSGGMMITTKSYFIDHWPETVISGVGSLVLWAGIPELATLFPDFASAVNLMPDPTVVSSFVCGFLGNSIADLVGARLNSVTGSSVPVVSVVSTAEEKGDK